MKEDYNVSDNINKPAFDHYIEELYKINATDKKRANRIAEQGLKELGLVRNKKISKHLCIDIEITIMILICIIIAACGLLVTNFEYIGLYFGGLIFFLSGLFVGLYVPIFGLIFLCSHAATGLWLMLSSFFGGPNDMFIIKHIANNPVFSDGGIPMDLQLYLGALLILLLGALIYTLLHNLSPRLKENKRHAIIILVLFLLLIIFTGLLPRFYPYLIS